MYAARGPLVLYVREGCHLCDQFLIELAIELGGQTAGLGIRNVDDDVELAVRYGLRVPVLECAGQVAGEGRFDRARFRELYPL
jgi:hypothetical protein